jgi:HSP20 family molecular chaperone IbpA
MAFFSQPGFSPLFQLLNDYEAQPEYKLHNEYQPVQCPKMQTARSFAPAFDVRELDEGYYLDGELPGVDQSNVEIEFSDPHTLVIKGHTDRDYNNDANATPSRSASPAGSAGWHQATVEDDDEGSVSSASTADTAASEPADKAQPHFWAKERSIGDFQRNFSFTARVDQDSVRASLKNGILSVFVPKEAVPLPKKIRIQ